MSQATFRATFPAEGDYVEFKTGLGSNPLQEAIVAFSNSRGGVILFGVDDHGRIVGRERTAGVDNAIHAVFADVRDPGRYDIRALSVEGTSITVVAVHPRTQGFAQTSSGRALIRTGARNQPLFGDQLLRFLTGRAFQRFEATEVPMDLEQASDDLIDQLAATHGWPKPAEVIDRLTEYGFVVAESGVSRKMSVLGALFLARDPSSLGKFYIEVFRFPPGTDDYDRREVFAGPLNVQVENATDFIMGELGTEPVVLGVRRYELPRLPRVVLREAIANAVGHRSYELAGTAIRIELRRDEVRIISPGSLPEPVTVANIREAQSARNPDILATLRRFRLAEDAGRGVDVMQDSMQAALLDPPQFVDNIQSVAVALPVRGPVSPVERAWVMEVERRGLIEPRDRILIVHAARGEALTNARARDLLGEDALHARQRLHRLRDAGLLEQSGERGGATYQLAGSLVPPTEVRVSAAELEQLVLQMARQGPVTNSLLRAELGLDRTDALRLLEGLVNRRRLLRVGERRGTHYELPDE
jgi:ATP-dependent DNA helicase RecG